MKIRAAALVRRGVDAALARGGYTGADRDLARAAVFAWARARLRWVRRRRPVVGGLRVVVARPGRALLVPMEVPLPGPTEVTVEMLVSAVSPGTERAQWLRLPNARPVLPMTPGYSGVGRVLAVGSATSGPVVGEHVVVPRAPHASVATVPAAWVVPVPPGVDLPEAALGYLAIIAGYGVRRAGIEPGAAVCVVGAGPIGALAHRLARLAGAGPTTVVARSRTHEARSRASGATDFRRLDEGIDDVAAAVVIEATGDPDAIGAAVTAARPGGTVVLLGSPRGVTRSVPWADVQRRGLRVVGAHISALAVEAKRTGADPFRALAETFLAGLSAGAVTAADLAGGPVDPREIGLFYRRLARGEVAAGHLDWRLLAEPDRVRSRRLVSAPLLPDRPRHLEPVPAPAPPAGSGALRFALIGCGDIGATNGRAVARASHARLVLLYDTVPDLAEAAAARHGGTAVATLEEALDPDRVDAVFLSVPHHLHAPLAVRAAAAGLHVIVEKPLAVDLASGVEATRAAEQAGVALSACFPYRYEPSTVAARELVRQGALGEFRGAALVFHADKPESYWVGGFSGRATSGWRQSRDQAGGGVLIMNMTHHIDLLRHLTGAEPARVSAVARTEPGAEVEDAITVSLGFDGGGVGSLIGSASTRGAPRSRFEMWGETGTLQLEPEPRIFTERAIRGVPPGAWHPLVQDTAVDERAVFVERFARAVLAGDPPDVTATDGLVVQAVVDAAYRSVARGGTPEAVSRVASSPVSVSGARR